MPGFPRRLPVGSLDVQQNLRAKLYIEDDDGPVAGFDLGRVEVDVETDYDYETDIINRYNLRMSMHTTTRLTLRGEVRQINDGTT